MIHCDDCTCPYYPGPDRCPHCGSTDAHEAGTPPDGVTCHHCTEEPTVPSISRNGGFTDATATEPVEAPDDAELLAEPEPAADPEPEPEPEIEPEQDESSPVDDGASDDAAGGGDADPAVPVRPAGNASTADWLAYCLAIGADLDPDGDYGRADLVAIADAIEADPA